MYDLSLPLIKIVQRLFQNKLTDSPKSVQKFTAAAKRITKSVKEKIKLKKTLSVNKLKLDISNDSPHMKRLENFEVIPFSGDYELSKAMVVNTLQKFEMFEGRTNEDLTSFFKLMVYCKDKEDAPYIIRQGDSASYFFVIEEGELHVQIDNDPEPKHILKSGDGFGEVALTSDIARTASVKVPTGLDKLRMWCINRDQFKKFSDEFLEKNVKSYMPLLDNLEQFSMLPKDIKKQMCENMKYYKYYLHDKIVEKDQESNAFYIIKSGEVVCLENNKLALNLVQGMGFGDKVFEHMGYEESTYRAYTEHCEILELKKEAI